VTTLSDAQIYSAAVAGGFTGQDAVIISAIALAESGGNSTVVSKPNSNGTVDYGLTQINSSHTALLQGGNWQDPTSNMQMAHTLYAAAGNKFTPWTTYKTGAYVGFLSRMQKAAGGGTVSVPSSTVVPVDNQTNSDGVQSEIQAATSGSVWLRIGYFVAGAVLIFIVAVSLIKNSSIGGAAMHVAKAAAVA
jgi:hypothetical protein